MSESISKKSVKKSVKKKAVARKAATKKAVAKKAVSKKAARSVATLTYQERYHKIAEAAYLLAEEQDFRPGNEMDNWLQAENAIDSWIKKDKIKLVD